MTAPDPAADVTAVVEGAAGAELVPMVEVAAEADTADLGKATVGVADSAPGDHVGPAEETSAWRSCPF